MPVDCDAVLDRQARSLCECDVRNRADADDDQIDREAAAIGEIDAGLFAGIGNRCEARAEENAGALAKGARLTLRFADEPRGSMTDFWFEPAEAEA